MHKGHGLEFSDYRQYELGDNPRYIDWKAYGRTDKLYVKRFQEEQDLLVSVFLDSSPSMGFDTDPEKWEFARKVALSFCYIGLMQQDRVGLSLLGQRGALTLSGPQAFLTLSDALPNALKKVICPSANHYDLRRSVLNSQALQLWYLIFIVRLKK